MDLKNKFGEFLNNTDNSFRYLPEVYSYVESRNKNSGDLPTFREIRDHLYKEFHRDGGYTSSDMKKSIEIGYFMKEFKQAVEEHDLLEKRELKNGEFGYKLPEELQDLPNPDFVLLD